MLPARHLVSLLLFVTLLTAGCPIRSATSVRNPVSGGSDGSSSLGRPGAEFGGGSGGDVADGLTAEFPECTEPLSADEWREEILRLVNQARADAGLRPVFQSLTLQDQAEQYACEMIHYDYFDHVNPVTGSTLGERAAEFGYDFLVVGENLAAGQSTPQQVFDDWMSSPGHRQNILDHRFVELGIGVRTGGRYRVYWVQEFGLPAP
jgi:uncharacterized protein YkwD